MTKSNEYITESQDFLKDDLRVFVVPVEILDYPDLTIHEQMAYMVLRSYASARESTAFPSYNTIADKARMSRRKAIDAVQGLVSKGLLSKETRLGVTKNRKIKNTSNLYTIHRPVMPAREDDASIKVVHEVPQPDSAQYAPTTIVHGMHQPSAQQTLTLVQDMHQPSAQDAPEQMYLTTVSEQNNRTTTKIAVADVSDDSQVQAYILTLKTVVGDQVSDASIRTWLKYGTIDRIIKCWFKANEKTDVEDIGAYVTGLLKMGADQESRITGTKAQVTDEEPVIMQMWKAKQEAAATAQVEVDDTHTSIVPVGSNEKEAKVVWASVLYVLEQNLSKPQFTTWFNSEKVKPIDYKQNTLIIETPSEFHRDWLENTFSIQIKNAVGAVTGKETAVKFMLPLEDTEK